MHASPEDIARAIVLLRDGRLVAFPTETVYGLGADAFDTAAVEAVFSAKGRPATNPLIVHVVDETMAQRVCAEWPAAAKILTKKFWPGPLTLVLPKAEDLPSIVTATGPTIAVRCPSHPLPLPQLETLGSAMVGPSANRSGRISPTCAAHVRESFAEEEVFILDGGPCTGGIESTVLDLTRDPPRILRPGLLSAEKISETLGTAVTDTQYETHNDKGVADFLARDRQHKHNEPARSPGMGRTHYAPLTPTRLVESGSLERELHTVGNDTYAVVLCPGNIDTDLSRESTKPPHRQIVMPSEPVAYAARLYAALHEADTKAAEMILVVQPWPHEPATGLWRALADRLTRATSPR